MKISELRLTTSDPHGQAAFYSGVLGLPASVGPSGAAEVAVGSTRLVFASIEGGRGNPVYHFAFNIPSRKFAEAKAWLRGRGVALLREGDADEFHSDNWDADLLYFRDPAGNIGELIARYTLPEGSSRPFAPSDLLCVSEIGLATPDVPALVDAVMGGLGLPLYLNSSDTFTTVGDERGLLIVVREGRPWFPTDTPAHPQPTVVVVEGEREGRYAAPALGYEVVVRVSASASA